MADQWQKIQERNGYPATTSGTDLSNGKLKGNAANASASRLSRPRAGDISIPLRRADVLQREHTARRLAAGAGRADVIASGRQPSAKQQKQPPARAQEVEAPAVDVDEAYLAQVYGKLWLDARRRALGAPYLRLATAPRPALTTRAGPRVSRLDYGIYTVCSRQMLTNVWCLYRCGCVPYRRVRSSLTRSHTGALDDDADAGRGDAEARALSPQTTGARAQHAVRRSHRAAATAHRSSDRTLRADCFSQKGTPIIYTVCLF